MFGVTLVTEVTGEGFGRLLEHRGRRRKMDRFVKVKF